ncbi:DUF3253 domain-containing protein [Haloferula sargassicola]|uniref:DUF3253 domain-containing protein n=1 Tax=Haloferula sargassicola TaxID=490096 RepID=A0ABP9UP01_9BACT
MPTPGEAILTLLSQRQKGSSICPSEAARLIDPENWRPHMVAVRTAAGDLSASGEIEICQGGEPVDPASLRGPIRLRLPS